ncbi:PREDICTED: early [Prunus dulcis]|uniref:PREDICTED: early n=1 Tax=Prunus dulcis TaxID=3755 RepID=A0A5E4EUB8_PRUDU|nr:PREDICTED: early [Prunus dulcis]
MRVNSMAKDGQNEQPTTATNSSENSQPAPSPLPPPSPKVVIPKFSDVLAFSGPAPERINGRIAMVALYFAICGLLGSSVEKGVSAESKSKGVMTSDAELWNGRLAMLGLVAMAFTEYVKGGTPV